MNNLVNKIIKLNIDEIDSFNFPLYELIGIEIIYNNIKFEFIAHFTENPNLICFGSGASPRSSKTSEGKLIKPPYFRRWSWYKNFNENFIAYADPIYYLDDEILVGWYVGDKNNWYLEIISKIIKKISDNRKISNNNILFFGSSGGGFSSVVLGTFIKDSKVLVNNTQFDVMNFNPEAVNKLFEILHYSFKDYSDEEIYNNIKHRLTCIELFKKLNYVPEITCYVNINSKKDIYDQCMPFIDELLDLTFFKKKFNVHFYQDNNGHHPMDNLKTINIIKKFSNEHLYNTPNKPHNIIENQIDYNKELVIDINFPNNNKVNAFFTYMSFFITWLKNDDNYQIQMKIREGVKSIALKKGFGTVNFSGIILDSHEVFVSYGGVDNYLNNSDRLIDNLNRTTPTLQVIFRDNTDSLDVGVKLPNDVVRRAIVTIGDTSKFVSLKNGVGSIKFNGLKIGSYEVKIQYNGDKNYKPVSISKTITIIK